MIRECCVDTIPDAIQAELAGADQLEWCADLHHDGLTPDYETTLALLAQVRIPVKVMIRSRPGDFVYARAEIKKMSHQAKKFSSLPGVSGLVFGATTNEKSLDEDSLTEIIKHCHGKPLTVHKAIDTCNDIVTEVRRLNGIPGVAFILTSGGKTTAWDGRHMIVEMRKNFNGKIIAAGKINPENLGTLHADLSLEYYHGRHIVR